MISRIAIFRALYLGDMLCVIPAIRAIRASYPEAEIFLVGLPWQRELVNRFPHYFNHFVEFPGWPGLPEQQPDRRKIIRFLDEIAAYRFDLVFQMQGNGEITNSLCMLWDAKKVCGLRKSGAYAPAADLFPLSEDSDHEVLRFFKLLECVNVRPQGTHLEFPLSDAELAYANSVLDQTGLHPRKYVCLHPGARDPRRRWPVGHFAFIARKLAACRYPIVLTGSIEEKELLRELQQRIATPVTNIVEAFGHLTAGQLAGILKSAQLLVSNDTGVSHIAAALQIKSVIIFSAFSDVDRWRPLDQQRHIAIPYEQATDPEAVWNRIMTLLEGIHSDARKQFAMIRKTAL